MDGAKTALQILTAALNEALRIIEAELDAGSAAQSALAELRKKCESEKE